MPNLNSPEDLNSLKRSDLQKLAKHHGIKANLKNDKLRNALTEVIFSPPIKPSTPTGSSGKQNASRKSDATVSVKGKPTPQATHKLKVGTNTPQPFSPKPCVVNRRLSSKTTPRIVKPVTPGRGTVKQSTPVPNVGEKKSQRRALDKDESVEGKPAKRQRRNTYDKDQPSPALIASPSGPDTEPPVQKDNGVEEMLSVMSGDITDDQMKQNLLNALDKRVPQKEDNNSERTKLPRYTGLHSAQLQKKPTTPGNKDWERIHNKNFSKMQSIDEYLRKKRTRTDQMSASMKMKQMRDKIKSNVDKLKSYQTPPSVKKSVEKMRKTAANARPKFASPAVKKFVPTVTSTSNANFDFAGATKKTTPATVSNKAFVPTVTSVSKTTFVFGGRKSAAKSPAQRKSPRLSGVRNENKRKSTDLNRTVTLDKTTPFKFGAANTSNLNVTVANRTLNSSINSTQKPKFDLKASLSKPVTWKPHTGALKPFSMNNSSAAFNNTRDVKGVQVKSKADRRAAQAKQRADRRLDVQLQRRGLQA